MNWIKLEEEQELESIKDLSNSGPVIIFKHSTRCSISSTAISRLERSWNESEMANTKPYYLDLIAHRDISNKIENDFLVRHESPQVLVIKNGKCLYYASHLA